MKSRFLPQVYFILVALEALASLLHLLSRPSDPENQWIAGFSFPRLVMIFLFLSFTGLGILATWKVWRYPSWGHALWRKMQQCPRCLLLVDIATFLFLSLLLTPSYRYGTFQNYFLSSLTILLYFSAITIQTELFF